MEWHSIPADNSDLAEIWEEVLHTPHEVTWQELGRFRWFVASYFHILESSWLQHRRGLLDQSGWIPLQAATLGLLKNPAVAAWWDGESAPFSQGFRAFVRDLREQNVDPGWRYQSHIEVHSQLAGTSASESKDTV